MKPLARVLSLAFLLTAFAACGGKSIMPAPTPTHPPAPTATATPSVLPSTLIPATETPMATITPELVQPTISSNLSAENAKTMVVEGGTWVVKNADGLVTATWDSAKSEWILNWENIKVQIGYIAMPTTVAGLEGMLPEDVYFSAPSEWKSPLPEVNKDVAPYVDMGFLGTHERTGTNDTVVTFANFGVDFRGVVFARPGDGNKQADIYVAGFSVFNRSHPDILYVLTVPIVYWDGMPTDLDILQNGTFTFDTIPMDQQQSGVKAPTLIEILNNPSTIGRRMVLSIRILNTRSNYNDLEVTPDNKRLAEAIQNGSILAGNLDIRLTLRNLHIPHDLHP